MIKTPPSASTDSLWWSLANAGWFSFLVGTALSLLGLFTGWYFYRKSLPRPSVQLTAETTAIVGPVHSQISDKLQIKYNGSEVTHVTSTTVALFNDGSVTFRASDIAAANPIRFGVAAGTLLQVDVIAVSRSVIRATVASVNDTFVEIGFDFLEPKDAIVVRLLHASDASNLTYSGTLIGLPQGLQFFKPFEKPKLKKTVQDKAALALLPIILIGIFWFVWYRAGWQKALIVPLATVAFAAFLFVFFWLMTAIDNRWKRAVPAAVLGNPELRKRLELEAALRQL